MNDKELIKRVGLYCRQFRINHLDISLTEFSEITNLNIKSVNAFEYGRANNIKYPYHYYKLANEEQKRLFATYIFDLI